jgi:UDP-3-O-[3-hydroxymyristoyl] glucosamine N-acyltransferase
MKIKAKEIAAMLNGDVVGDPEIEISRPSRIENGEPGSLTFLANPKYEQYAYRTKASIILVSQEFIPSKPINATLIKVKNVYESMAQLADRFEKVQKPSIGVSTLAQVHPSAKLGENVSIGSFVVIEADVVIGDHSIIMSQVYIGKNSRIGDNVCLHPGVRVYHEGIIGNRVIINANSVIGSDGFGFVKDQNGNFKKIKQLGNVLIEDDVEIGSNVVIDRASLGSTVIRSGAKLDNLIQVAHNVEIGTNTAMAAQVGIAGSSKIGADCLIGGQVGVAGHLKIGDKTEIQAQSGVASNTPDSSRLYGSPALEYRQYLKSYAVFKKLPDLLKELNNLREKVDLLSQNGQQGQTKS